MAQDPYAQIAKPLNDDPYASIAVHDELPSVPKAPVPAGLTGPSKPNIAGGLLKAYDVANDIGTGIDKGIGATGNAVGHMLLPDFAVRTINRVNALHPNAPQISVPSEEQQQSYFKPANTTQAVSKGIEQAGEFLLPGGAEEKAASLLPRAVRPLGRIAASALSSGGINKLQGGDFSTGALAGGVGSGIGQGLKASAPALAETALKVRGNQRLFGRTVGDAILNDTHGIRPETIGRSAQDTIRTLTPILDAADQRSASQGLRGSLKPARDAVSDMISGHQANRAMNTAGEITPVSDFLKTDQLTGLPLSEQQAAPGLRSLKRGLNSDFISQWKPEESVERKQAARAAYGRLNEELHAASPGTKEIDQRISSLIPVKQQGERVASGAPITQRILGRVGAHTGALTLGGIGAAGGYKEGGTKGAIAGGLTGVLAPELIASPEGQMAVARILNKSGALRPIVGAGLQADRERKK